MNRKYSNYFSANSNAVFIVALLIGFIYQMLEMLFPQKIHEYYNNISIWLFLFILIIAFILGNKRSRGLWLWPLGIPTGRLLFHLMILFSAGGDKTEFTDALSCTMHEGVSVLLFSLLGLLFRSVTSILNRQYIILLFVSIIAGVFIVPLFSTSDGRFPKWEHIRYWLYFSAGILSGLILVERFWLIPFGVFLGLFGYCFVYMMFIRIEHFFGPGVMLIYPFAYAGGIFVVSGLGGGIRLASREISNRIQKCRS
jgi:hypothetical protein